MKRAWFVLLVALLAAMICNAALAEGLQGDGDRTGEQAVAARAVELPVSEVSEAPLPESGNDMVSADFAVEAAAAGKGVAIDKDNFPDEAFRGYVKEECDQNGDGALSEDEIKAVYEIYVDEYDIASLKGIEWFRNLELLGCSSNRLTSLDVSGCTKLVSLSCQDNRLTQLNVSGCTKLWDLYCQSNQLTALDLSGCTGLVKLRCNDNRLTRLDLSKCRKLEELRCFSNQLTSLDLSGNTALEKLSCYNNKIARIDISKCDKALADAVAEAIETTDKGSVAFGRKIGSFYPLETDSTTAVIVNGKTVYGGKQKAAKSLAKAKVIVKAQTWTGKALTPKATVKLGGKTLKKDKDYTVSYTNNSAIGEATVTVTGKGNYTGTAKATFRINPKKVTGLKLEPGAGKLTASWNKVSGVDGYQIEYGLKQDFKGAKKVKVQKAETAQKALTRLGAGKTYYVRVRAYKKVGKKTYCSAWTKGSQATK